MNWCDFLAGATIAFLGILTAGVILAWDDEPDDWEDEHERWCDCLCPRCSQIPEGTGPSGGDFANRPLGTYIDGQADG